MNQRLKHDELTVRVWVSLPASTGEQIRNLAAEHGVTMTQIIRSIVEEHLARSEKGHP